MRPRFECMTPAELALWQIANAALSKKAAGPCSDCPMEFHLAEKAAGRCVRFPPRPGRPISKKRQQQLRNAARSARMKARLRADVEAIRLARAHAKGYTVRDEYSVAIAHTAQRPADRLYSGRRGVDVPEYRRNA